MVSALGLNGVKRSKAKFMLTATRCKYGGPSCKRQQQTGGLLIIREEEVFESLIMRQEEVFEIWVWQGRG